MTQEENEYFNENMKRFSLPLPAVHSKRSFSFKNFLAFTAKVSEDTGGKEYVIKEEICNYFNINY
jgi:hypothetical protein